MKALAELIERVAELERRVSRTDLHGPVTDRKKIKGQWRVRVRIGGTDDKPMKTPWISYGQIAGALKVHWVPSVGQQMTVHAPDAVPEQAVAIPMTWSDGNKSPSDDGDAVVITHDKFKLSLKGGKLLVEAQEIELKCGESSVKITGEKITLKSALIETDGKTKLDKGDERVLTEGGPAQRVYART